MTKLKSEAKKMCTRLNLSKLRKSVEKSTNDYLDVFFNVKTHKIDAPFRVIVSEHDSWQKPTALFLQEKLKILPVNDPFLVKNSNDVLRFVSAQPDKNVRAFSIDTTDLYYSLPHDDILICVERAIDEYGAISFQNETGLASKHFLELLQFYLKYTYIKWEDGYFLQKKGICIGSCIAPILSDLFLSHLDKTLADELLSTVVCKGLRYVDDYVFLLECSSTDFNQEA